MKKPEERLKTAVLTFEKYQKNKTMVPMEDLKGKYRVPYQKLKKQLADEVEAYIKAYCFGDMIVQYDDAGVFVEKVETLYQEQQFGKRIGAAVFKHLDLDEMQALVDELRTMVWPLYEEYLNQRPACRETREGLEWTKGVAHGEIS